jgi:DNA-binding HxlR family transcriptional regulator
MPRYAAAAILRDVNRAANLTKLGRSLLDPVNRLGVWARKNRGAIADARSRFDSRRALYTGPL